MLIVKVNWLVLGNHLFSKVNFTLSLDRQLKADWIVYTSENKLCMKLTFHFPLKFTAYKSNWRHNKSKFKPLRIFHFKFILKLSFQSLLKICSKQIPLKFCMYGLHLKFCPNFSNSFISFVSVKVNAVIQRITVNFIVISQLVIFHTVIISWVSNYSWKY